MKKLGPLAARRHTINSYQIAEKNLMGHVKEKKKRYDLLTAVMICLGDPHKAEAGGFMGLLVMKKPLQSFMIKKMHLLEVLGRCSYK
jgi:hypothetical protein